MSLISRLPEWRVDWHHSCREEIAKNNGKSTLISKQKANKSGMHGATEPQQISGSK
jgi:hypothetical protein